MIFFIRHGQTNDNINNVFSGSRDVKVNKTGKKQIKQTAKNLKNLNFDLAICSPMKRAKQTLNAVKKYHPNLPVIFDERIKERDHGTGENVKVNSVSFKSWSDKDDGKYFLNCESPIDVYNRVKNFYDEILSKYKNKNILIIAHLGIFKVTYAYFNGLPKNYDFSNIDIDNSLLLMFNK